MTISSRLLTALLAAPLAVSLLVACGSDTSEGDDVPASELTETTTPEALAAAVLADLDVEPISLEATEVEDDAPEGAVAVSMRLPLSYDDSGMLLRVGAASEIATSEVGCGEDEFEDGCTDDELPDGGRQLVTWQAEEPEEDPGIVQVLAERADPEATVVVYLSGPMIPEDLTDDTDLELFTLGDLKDLTLDPALGPTTTPELVEAGEDLPDEWWVEPGSEG